MVLKLLLDGDKYGYEIAKLIQANSGGEYELKEATLYSSLKRLEIDTCITAYWGIETQGGADAITGSPRKAKQPTLKTSKTGPMPGVFSTLNYSKRKVTGHG